MRRFLALALLTFLPLVACTSAPPREPEADFTEVRPLIYDYGLVFDCVVEAITDENFQIGLGDRDTGEIESKVDAGLEDRVRQMQPGRRIRARVIKRGPKDFVVRLAASKLERDISQSQQAGEWRYIGKDPELLEKLKARFDKEVEKRYKQPSKG